jgi:hypothetical protein
MASKLLAGLLISLCALAYGNDVAAQRHDPPARARGAAAGIVVEGDAGALQPGSELRVVAIRPVDDAIVLLLRDVASGADVTVRVAAVSGRDVAISVGMTVIVVNGNAQSAARAGRALFFTPAGIGASGRP